MQTAGLPAPNNDDLFALIDQWAKQLDLLPELAQSALYFCICRTKVPCDNNYICAVKLFTRRLVSQVLSTNYVVRLYKGFSCPSELAMCILKFFKMS